MSCGRMFNDGAGMRFLPIISIFLFLALFPTSSGGQSLPESGTASAVSDRDRQLLEKIDRLERRIAELEARAGIDSATKQTDPAAIANSNISQADPRAAAEAPAKNSSASPAEAEAPFA